MGGPHGEHGHGPHPPVQAPEALQTFSWVPAGLKHSPPRSPHKPVLKVRFLSPGREWVGPLGLEQKGFAQEGFANVGGGGGRERAGISESKTALSAQSALGEEGRQRPRPADFPGQACHRPSRPKMGGVAPCRGLVGNPHCSAGGGVTGTSVGTHQSAGLVMTFTLPGKHANHVPSPEITRPLGLRKLISLVGCVCARFWVR